MMRLWSMICVVPLMTGGALAQDLDRDALQLISETAQDICGEIMTGGENREVEIEGQVSAELRGLARQLASAGIDGSARLEDGDYAGVLREELDTERQSARECRRALFERLLDRLDAEVPSNDESGVLEPGESVPGTGSGPADYSELAGMVLWGPYINCSVYNDRPELAQVTSINFMLDGTFGPHPVNIPCGFNCIMEGYGSTVFSGPQNNPNVTTAQCWVTALR